MYPIPHDGFLVPYLAHNLNECNQHNFIDYPTQHQISPAELRKRGAGYKTQELDSIAALLQQWLVFGLMRTLFEPSGIPININDFVLTPDRDDDTSMNIDQPETGVTSDVSDDDGAFEDSQAEDESYEFPAGGPSHLSEILRDSEESVESCGIDPENMLSNDELCVVDTRYIIRYLIYLWATEYFLDDAARQEILRSQHTKIFNTVEDALQELISWRAEFYPVQDSTFVDSPLVDEVILSAVLLTEYLYYTTRDIFFNGVGVHHRYLDIPLDNSLRRRLFNSCWCPGEITTLNNKFRHATSLYMIGSLDRTCLASDHLRCTSESCVANQIDSSTYETRHISPDCDCAFIEDPKGGAVSAIEILRSGHIPVVAVTASSDSGDAMLSVIPSDNVPYVAISHVWSDGLGNPRNNALPTCQLQRLQQWVDDLYPESSEHIPFWIDTLCVPLDTEVRKQAIRLMGETYHASNKVLVLDDWLIKTEISNSFELFFLKIKACTWTQRLWTLQEGMLAKKHGLYFQTSEGFIAEEDLFQDISSGIEYMTSVLRGLVGRNGDRLQGAHPETATAILESLERHTIWEEHSPDQGFLTKDFDTGNIRDQYSGGLISQLHGLLVHTYVWMEGRDYFRSLRGNLADKWAPYRPDKPDSSPVAQSNTVITVGHNMKNRATSRIEDEAVCFATLLGLDIRAILDRSSNEERMEFVFSQLQHVSALIVFSHSPRIDRAGLRWAPATLRANTKTYEPGITIMNPGQIRPEGLVVRFGAFMFREGTGSEVAVPTTQIEVESLLFTIKESGQHGLYSPSQRVWNAALLYGEHGAQVSGLNTNAILLELVETKDDIVFARFLGHYHIKCEGPGRSRIPEGRKGTVIQSQRWCIG